LHYCTATMLQEKFRRTLCQKPDREGGQPWANFSIETGSGSFIPRSVVLPSNVALASARASDTLDLLGYFHLVGFADLFSFHSLRFAELRTPMLSSPSLKTFQFLSVEASH
jgi:hypothetical protein